MLDIFRYHLWRFGTYLEMNDHDSLALWFYAWAAWLPW